MNRLYLCIFSLLMFVSCTVDITDLSKIDDFHNCVSEKIQKSQQLDATVDLYVDYSTCVASAVKSSTLFKNIQPLVIERASTFYSIKGTDIKAETQDKATMSKLFFSITEHNFADIQGAVERITAGNSQAILITDGEYIPCHGFQPDFAYLKDAFVSWLSKGNDIYMYIEKYDEPVGNTVVEKYRYYMLFTNTELEDNIQTAFYKNIEGKPYNVPVFHLSNKILPLMYADTYPQINETVSPSEETGHFIQKGSSEVIEVTASWSDMYTYLVEDYNYFLKGLYINSSETVQEESFLVNPNGVSLEVYDVYDSYEKMFDDTIVTPCRLGKQLKNIFVINKDTLQTTGEIQLFLSPDFDGSDLSSERPNLLRVDIVAENMTNNFKQKGLDSFFTWESTTKVRAGEPNVQLANSIGFTLDDLQIKPCKQILYTFYISTFKN